MIQTSSKILALQYRRIIFDIKYMYVNVPSKWILIVLLLRIMELSCRISVSKVYRDTRAPYVNYSTMAWLWYSGKVFRYIIITVAGFNMTNGQRATDYG